jgi:hypothetical protein
MSLEEALRAHTLALETNTAAVLRFTDTFTGALAARVNGAAKAEPAKAEPKEEPKAEPVVNKAAEPVVNKAAEPAAEPAADKPKRGRPPKAKETPKVFTIDDLRAKAAEYLRVSDEKQKEQRKTKVGEMLAHFGVDKVTAIGADQYGEAIGYFDVLLSGGTPNYQAENDAELDKDDDESDDLI